MKTPTIVLDRSFPTVCLACALLAAAADLAHAQTPLTSEQPASNESSFTESPSIQAWVSTEPGRRGVPAVSKIQDAAGDARRLTQDGLQVNGRLSVLVTLKPQAAHQPILNFAQGCGADCKYEYEILPDVMNVRDLPPEELQALTNLPGVLKVEMDRMVYATLDDSEPLIRGLRSQLAAEGLPATGSGVRVCVIDTGIDSNHTMYTARIDTAAGFDFVNNDSDPEDGNGHGSHVAGIALGRTGFLVDVGEPGNPQPLQGVAPEATLIGVKVLSDQGSGSFSDVIAGIEHCADPALAGGPADVINMSLGGGLFLGACDDDLAAQAANAAVAAGVVVVASAGNNASPNGLGTPSCASDVISVSATWDADFPNPEFPNNDAFQFSNCTDNMPRADQLTCFSNRNVGVDVAAPGCLTFSAERSDLDGVGTTVSAKCGTSMSSPHVAGLAALILETDPSLTPAQVRQVIRDSAVDLGPPGFDTGYGFGRIDVISALKLVSGCLTNADCDDGLFCNGAESCVGNACVRGASPCPGQQCDEASDLCIACNFDFECNDGVVCNGLEACSGGVCIPGGDACNGRMCDPVNNRCADCLSNADCDDLDPCNGDEFCGEDGSCFTVLVDCNDNLMADSCDLNDGTSVDLDPVNGVPDECDALVRYTVTQIPTFGGPSSRAFGLNNAGQVVGQADTVLASPTGAAISHAFLYDNGVMTDLGTLGGDNSTARAINNLGVITGSADVADSPAPPPLFVAFRNRPVIWNSGTITDLGTLESQLMFLGTGLDINDSNQIVGENSDGFESSAAVRWNVPGSPQLIPNIFGGNLANAWGINNKGDAVGWMIEFFALFNRHAFFQKNGGTVQDIGSLGGTFVEAYAINDFAVVVGQSTTTLGFFKAFSWTAAGGMVDLGSLGGGSSTARHVSNDGIVVGRSLHAESSPSPFHAFVLDGPVMEDLNDLIPGDSGLVLVEAWKVNDVGQIAGVAINAEGNERGFLLTPCGDASNPCFGNECSVDGDCDDGLFCNGAESCVSGNCSVGTDPCAAGETCDENTDTCIPVGGCQSDAECDDGLFCNGVETCVAESCVAGVPVNCDDGVGCTDDSCNESTDTCDNAANDANCDNGLFCDGSETCDVALDCQSGGAVDCDDGVGCTIDACNEATDTCDNTPDDGACDDGLFCNGAETCDAQSDCLAGSDPCSGAACDESTDTCESGRAIWISFKDDAAVPGVGTVADEDIVAYDVANDSWSLVFDGSDVGLAGLDIDGLAVLPDGDILLSFTAEGTIPSMTGGPNGDSADDSDIVRFTPTSLGANTAGSFSFYFDGSDVGLSSNSEDVDAIGLDDFGRLVISTSGGIRANGARGADEDLWTFEDTGLGASTSGSFSRLFDGSDVGLSNSGGEDVDAVSLDLVTGSIVLSHQGSFEVTGVSGADEDLNEFFPTQLGNSTSGTFSLLLDLSTIGISSAEDVGAIEWVD